MEKSPKYRLQENPLDSLDFKSQEFKDGTSELARLLKIPEHPDHLVTLRAINHLIQARLCASERANKDLNSAHRSDNCVPEQAFTLDSSPLGFQVKDKQLERPAKVLRMLYINDLRDLQNKVNQIIVSVQSITANPKTDSLLGQVGR